MNRFCFLKKMLVLFVLIGVIGFAGSHVAFAQPPPTMEYKGYLEEDGASVNTTLVNSRRFAVFLTTDRDADWEGDDDVVLWRRVLGVQQVLNGHFTLVFSPPEEVLKHSPLFIRVRVNKNNTDYVTLTGAQELRATPHARTSEFAVDATNATRSSQDFNVGRNLVVEGTATLDGDVKIVGNETTGTNDTTTALRIWNSNDRMAIDSNEIDSTSQLRIQANSNLDTFIGDDLTVARNLTVQDHATIQNNLTVRDNFTVEDNANVQDNLTVGGSSQLDGKVKITVSHDTEGPDDIESALRIWSGNNMEKMSIDGNEIDSNGSLYLQTNSEQRTIVGGNFIVGGSLQGGVSYRFHTVIAGEIVNGVRQYPVSRIQDIGPSNGQICSFAFMHDSSGNHGDCELSVDRNRWKLRAQRNNDGAPRECKAVCIIWPGITQDPSVTYD